MKFTTLLISALATLVAASPAMPQGAEEHAMEPNAAPMMDADAAEPMAAAPQGMEEHAAQPMADIDAAEPAGWGCKPGTYRCSPYRNGWDVCNTGRTWVNGGSCGRRQYCAYNWQSESPYCYNWGTAPV